jgi:hypothetical protein
VGNILSPPGRAAAGGELRDHSLWHGRPGETQSGRRRSGANCASEACCAAAIASASAVPDASIVATHSLIELRLKSCVSGLLAAATGSSMTSPARINDAGLAAERHHQMPRRLARHDVAASVTLKLETPAFA